MSRKQRIIISITGIVLVSLILIGLTYGYYLTKIKGNTNSKSISVVTANLLLEYADVNDELITDSAVEPGKSWTKTFVATNKGNKTLTYGVALEKIVNQFERKDDIVYTLDCKQYSKTGFSIDKTNKTVTGTISGTCNGVSAETTFPSIGTILVQNDIADDKAQVYTLLVTYKETNTDQSVDMNKTFSAKANIVDPNNFKPYGEGTLATAIIDSAKTAASTTDATRTIYQETPTTTPGQAISAFIYLKGTDPTSFTSTLSNATNYYISYADDYTVNETTGKITLVNPTIATAKYTTSMASSLVGKYAVWSTSTPTTSNTQNQSSIYKISTNVSDIVSTIKYATINSSSLTKKSTEKVLSITEDDYGTSYYYRGGVEDNFVNYAGMCWRIVRIEGDGSIKLILASELSCSDTNVTTSSGYATDGGAGTQGTKLIATYGYKKVGYKYIDDYINSAGDTTGNARTKLNAWLERKITSESDKALLKNEDWCIGDRTTAYDYSTYALKTETAEELINAETSFRYSAGKRIWSIKTPTLKCDGNKEKDGEIDTNKVGMLTADEVAFAGADGNFNANSTYYLNKNATSNRWWTLSPSFFKVDGPYVLSFGVNSFGYLGGANVSYVDDTIGSLRVAVSLASSAKIISGDGTVNNAYTVG